nr:hypothetical protein [Microbacterium bovistercoris]
MTGMSMTAKDLLARLERHYIKPSDDMPGGVFLPEVTLGGRRADALYVGFFASRGKHLVGHEIKVARPDWLHELDNPHKAEVWEPECHAWYVVAPHTEVVRPEELPEGWGLLVPGKSRTRLTVVTKATVHADRVPSWEATHALVQRSDSLRMKAIADYRQQANKDALERAEKIAEQRIAAATGDAALQQKVDAQKKLIHEIQDALGLKIRDDKWGYTDGEVTVNELRGAFGRYLRADRDTHRAVEHTDRSLKQALNDIADAMQALAGLNAEAGR